MYVKNSCGVNNFLCCFILSQLVCSSIYTTSTYSSNINSNNSYNETRALSITNTNNFETNLRESLSPILGSFKHVDTDKVHILLKRRCR